MSTDPSSSKDVLQLFSVLHASALSWLVTFWVQQNMYDEGDDEMKKTIAKAWSDARTGKPAQPPKYGDLQVRAEIDTCILLVILTLFCEHFGPTCNLPV